MPHHRLVAPSHAVWVVFRDLQHELNGQLDKPKNADLKRIVERLEWCLHEVTAQAEFQAHANLWNCVMDHNALSEKAWLARSAKAHEAGMPNPWEHYDDALPYTAIIRDLENAYEADENNKLDAAERIVKELTADIEPRPKDAASPTLS